MPNITTDDIRLIKPRYNVDNEFGHWGSGYSKVHFTRYHIDIKGYRIHFGLLDMANADKRAVGLQGQFREVMISFKSPISYPLCNLPRHAKSAGIDYRAVIAYNMQGNESSKHLPQAQTESEMKDIARQFVIEALAINQSNVIIPLNTKETTDA